MPAVSSETTTAAAPSVQALIQTMIRNGDIGRRLFVSYGSMTTVFSYLSQIEVLSFQVVNKFMYQRGVERVLQKISLPAPEPVISYFHYTFKSKWQNYVFAYDTTKRRALKPIKLPALLRRGISSSLIVQYLDQLLLFKPGESVQLFQLRKLLYTAKFSHSALPSLNRKAYSFALANYKNQRIYLSGDKSDGPDLVDYYDIKQQRWIEAPPLNHGRCNHSSASLGRYVFVFGGYGSYGSIESLEVTTHIAWALIITSNQLTKRQDTAVAILSEHQIFVFGGNSYGF